MSKITPFLWFDNQAEEAMNFYISLFNNSKIVSVSRYGEGAPVPAGTVMSATFELDGQTIMALNAGPQFKFNEAISFYVDCVDQAEVDKFWNALTANGGEEGMCGWLKDKFGLSWQIVPRALGQMLGDPDPDKSRRAMEAMLKMKKIDVPTLQKAYNG
ncbi:MAG: VOC family protein [Anaerolineaceae bacterium]|nr:VOC family protein [Anaerolineaceae bacterium]